MPNHVTNEIIASPTVIKALLNEKGEIDFNALIPMPKELEGTTAGYPKDANAEELKAKYGYENWYDWCCDKWGTKWNAYDQSPVAPQPGDLAKARFDTAWSTPRPIILALAQRFPEEEIILRYADEDLGNNLGDLTIKGLTITEDRTPDEGTREAVDFAARLKYNQTVEELEAEQAAEEIEYRNWLAQQQTTTTVEQVAPKEIEA